MRFSRRARVRSAAIDSASQDADLTLTKSHNGNFTQGQIGATYHLVAQNIGAAASTGVASTAPGRGNPRWKPSAPEFGHFAHAVAARYGAQVDRYLLWNEPNSPGWLQPQNECRRGVCTPVAPHLYRALVRAATPKIHAADPGSVVLLGEPPDALAIRPMTRVGHTSDLGTNWLATLERRHEIRFAHAPPLCRPAPLRR